MNHSINTQLDLIGQLRNIVGDEQVITKASKTHYYRKGFRSGEGSALAVVFPQSLLQQWKVLQACVADNKIIIMQAANTGLTEGSTPSGDSYDREVVIVNATRMTDIILLDKGKQIISFPGATLHSLEKLLKPLKRSPHSVIGSSCIGASIVGGVANNSGGSLIQRGPAYTELALFSQVNANGELQLVNHLGIDLGDTPEQILTNLQNHDFLQEQLEATDRLASDSEYTDRIRDTAADTPARYNADHRRLYETSGCAGKLAVFAVRLDTFPVAEREQVFYIGVNNDQLLTTMRRDILQQFQQLPESAEYLHRDIFNVAEKYGKDVFLMINYLGTDLLPRLFALKGAVTSWMNKVPFLPHELPDRVMQFLSRLWPQALPKRLCDYRDRYEHHLILKMTDKGVEEAQSYLKAFFANVQSSEGGYFACSKVEAKKAYLHRFAAAGSAVRYQTMHDNEVEDILALDVALRRNQEHWVEQLPEEISSQLECSLYYGHFLCYVFHRDYILKKGADATKIKQQLLELLDQQGAKYPAEHNVGHLYQAEPQLLEFYKQLDPTNTFNPGIGKASKHKDFAGERCGCC